jgi:hypothetical protein
MTLTFASIETHAMLAQNLQQMETGEWPFGDFVPRQHLHSAVVYPAVTFMRCAIALLARRHMLNASYAVIGRIMRRHETSVQRLVQRFYPKNRAPIDRFVAKVEMLALTPEHIKPSGVPFQ